MELGSTDSKRFVHKRIRWCTKSNRITKALETKLILKAVKGDLLEDGAISDLDLKVAEHMFPFEQDKWQEIEQHCDDISGKLLPVELKRAGLAEEIRRCESKCTKKDRRTAARGIKTPPVRWVDVKGDEGKHNVRCRLVRKELQAKTKEAYDLHMSFSAQCLRGRQSSLYSHF